VNGATSRQDRYFISSLDGDARRMLRAVRSHWGIENSLHWVLDIAFDEDHQRVRKDNGPANFAVLRHITLNLLKQDKTVKAGIKAKRLNAGWDEPYLLKVLFGQGN
jgi:predicted transposase YbfD/YdcC